MKTTSELLKTMTSAVKAENVRLRAEIELLKDTIARIRHHHDQVVIRTTTEIERLKETANAKQD